MLPLTFNPGLMLTGFRTTRPSIIVPRDESEGFQICILCLYKSPPIPVASQARERRRAKRSGGNESGEDVPRSVRLAAAPLDFALAATRACASISRLRSNMSLFAGYHPGQGGNPGRTPNS